MRAAEHGANIGFRLRTGDRSDPGSLKTCRGTDGGYTDYLGETEIELLDQYIVENLNCELGYNADPQEPVTPHAPDEWCSCVSRAGRQIRAIKCSFDRSVIRDDHWDIVGRHGIRGEPRRDAVGCAAVRRQSAAIEGNANFLG